MKEKGSRGFSLAEMVVALAIFGVLILVLAALEYQLFGFERAVRLDAVSRPVPGAVLARIRSDVLSCKGRPDSIGEWSEGPATLLLTLRGENGDETVIWDFSERMAARRIVMRGSELVSEWHTTGVPSFRISTWMLNGGRLAVRLIGTDEEGGLVVDQIITPRVTGA